jgi:hypothetical protein
VYLDIAADDAAFGGYLYLDGRSFWAGVVGMGGHPLIALRDDELPNHRGLDVRTDGLWASITCEEPGEHWSAAMEAFAVGYDDPADAAGDERGDIVALGFDLEWERVGELWQVHGEVLVGESRVALDTYGSTDAAVVTGRIGSSALITDAVPDDVQLQPRWPAPIKGAAGASRALCRLVAGDGSRGVAWVGGPGRKLTA